MIGSGAREVGTGTGHDRCGGLRGLVGVLGFLGAFGSSWGTTMEPLRFADGGPQEPRGSACQEGYRERWKSPQRDQYQAEKTGMASHQRQGPSLSGQASLRAKSTKENTAGDTRHQTPA